MDTLTHALSGMLLARATAPAQPRAGQLPLRSRMLVGFLAGAFPDSDVVMRFFFDVLTYLNLHRGVTHSLPLLPLWALLLAGLFALLWHRHYGWRAFYGVTLLALFIHVVGDVITAYGTKLFAPFSDAAFALPVIFIIDPWFSGIIVAALLAAWWRHSRWPAIFGLVVLAGYVGGQTWQMTQARELAAAFAVGEGLAPAAVQALPQPLSPFHWKLVVPDGKGYRIADVNLRRSTAPAEPAPGAFFLTRVAALYRPADDLRWYAYPQFGADPALQALAEEVWAQPVLAGMRRFAQLPALQAVVKDAAGVCVWFRDLRFELRDLRNPFVFGACRAADEGEWRLERLGTTFR